MRVVLQCLLSIYVYFFGCCEALEFDRKAYPLNERCNIGFALDIDGDGKLELLALTMTRVLAIKLPEGTIHELFDTKDGYMMHAVLFDADGDGDLDLGVCRWNNPWVPFRASGEKLPRPLGQDFTIGWFENIGRLETWPLHVVDTQVHETHGIASADLDGDGRQDLIGAHVMGHSFPRSLTWWRIEDGVRRFIRPNNAGPRPHYLACGDLNGNGAIDVVCGTGGGWSVHYNPGKTGAPEATWSHASIGNAAGGTNVGLADIDADGRLDVVGSCGHGRGIFWFTNPNWTQHIVHAGLRDVHSLAVGDLDGDGRPDIVANSFTEKSTHVFLNRIDNDGKPSWVHTVIDQGNGQESYGCSLFDVNGDGKLDIVLGGRNSKNLVWYQQR